MKHIWALPAVLRLALASQHAFSVLEDLLAYPQYEVQISDSFVTEAFAEERLARARDHTASTGEQPVPGQDLSKPSQRASSGGRSSSGSNDKDASAIPENTYETLILQGSRYLCRIPIVIPEEETEPQLNETEKALEAEAEAKELARATDRGWELLQGMNGNCIYFVSGWWSYSFCYNDQITQFHPLPPGRGGVPHYPPTPDPGVQSYTLGMFPHSQDEDLKRLDGKREDREESRKDATKGDEKGLARLETRGETRYLVQNLGGGTTCDLTGKERKIEVQFHCHPQSADHIHMIKEVQTCSYLMVIYTPRLCNDVAFVPSQENNAHKIACQHILAESEIPAYKQMKMLEAEEAEKAAAAEAAAIEDAKKKKAAQKGATEDEGTQEPGSFLEALLNAFDSSHHPQRPLGRDPSGPVIIGGTEVGAQELVGGQGRTIEKGVVAGGKGKEVWIGTVASSDGKQMSREEMRKLDIMDVKDVERLKRDMQKISGGKPWKLDLVDTPRGREFRGVLEDDEEAPKGQQQQQQQKKKNPQEGQQRGAGKERRPAEGDNGHEGSEETYKKDEL